MITESDVLAKGSIVFSMIDDILNEGFPVDVYKETAIRIFGIENYTLKLRGYIKSVAFLHMYGGHTCLN